MLDPELGLAQDELTMSTLVPSNMSPGRHSTETSTDPEPPKSIASNSRESRSDFICMAIGRATEWQLCHVKFPVNGQSIHHDGRRNAETDAGVFRRILETFRRELSKKWFRQIVFPVKLSRVEYWEVSQSSWPFRPDY
jgi:hypothetical protein